MTPGEASSRGALLEIGGVLAAHTFDIEGGVAFIESGWSDSAYGGGQPCHQLPGDFEPYQGHAWIALDTEHGDIIVHRRTGKPDGTREEARSTLERSLGITIPTE